MLKTTVKYKNNKYKNNKYKNNKYKNNKNLIYFYYSYYL